jgi:KaiC/GvpD/RAD55 family RecA-like ATPase
MEIVVNEWLLDYMCPNSDSNKTAIAIQFINAVVKKCDKIVIRRPSPFVSKFYRYMKEFGWDPRFKERYKKLNHLLFLNSDKVIIADNIDIEKLPKEVEKKIPNDDRYLVELAYFSKDKIIVTTDERLKEKLRDEDNLKVCLPEEFFKEYLS